MNLIPEYYNNDGIDVIDVSKLFDMNFNLGNVLKYIVRAGLKDKDTHIEDLKKAEVYLKREIEYYETIEKK